MSVPADDIHRTPRRERDRALGQLIVKVAHGDRSAFPLLYGATRDEVYGLVRQVLRDPDQSAEVTQEAYLKIWSRASRFDPDRGAALPWIHAIARGCSIDRVRSAEVLKRHDALSPDPSAVAGYDQTAATAEAHLETLQLRHALAALTEVQSEAIRLVYYDGRTHVQTANHLRIPIGTAKSRIRDALIRLRTVLDAESAL